MSKGNGPLAKGTRLRKRYTVIGVLGISDFSSVYLARDSRAAAGRRRVALKQMPMQMIVDCERQAHWRALVRHPTIPRVLDYFVTDTHSYLVEELIVGSNLEVYLEQYPGFLPEKTVIRWAMQLCDALDHLHQHPLQSVIHRDLKPNNLMVDQAGNIHVIDLGLARIFPPGFFQKSQPQFRHLRRGTALGTAGYSPPEQYKGIVTPASDIYALGATLHQVLTRRDPRKEKPFTFKRFPVRSLNPAISAGLDRIVMKALNRDPRRRYPSARAMGSALAQL